MTIEEKAGQLTILADTIRPSNPDINPEVRRVEGEGLGRGRPRRSKWILLPFSEGHAPEK